MEDEWIKIRSKYCNDKLEKTIAELNESEFIKNESNLSIYCTGSYGRLEASEFSDLDIFFLFKDENNLHFSKISKTLIDADVIKTCRKMEFPEFSADGRYLEIHNIDEIIKDLGSPNDDFRNFFTARMLLILESRPLINSDLYGTFLKEILDSYFKDFHEHEDNFIPVFLINDISRFWRTMCLNYEHHRNRENTKNKNKAHIKNLKLKFSRKLICYSFLIRLLWHPKNGNSAITEEDLLEIIKETPIERLFKVKTLHPSLNKDINNMFDLYKWYLNTTQISEENLINWIDDPNNRRIAFDKSREFGRAIFNTMICHSQENTLLYYLV